MTNVYRKRKPRSSRKFTKKSTKKTISNVKQIVKKTINNMAETKQIGNNPALYTWNTSNTTMSLPIKVSNVWDMGLGTANGNRIGNKINVTKAVMNINITANNFASSYPGPYIVSIYFGYLRGNRGQQPSASDLQRFLQDGPTSIGMNQQTLSLLRNINTDVFVVTNKLRFKVGQSSVVGASYTQNNNDFPLFVNKKISLKTMLGPLFYDDNAGAALNKDLYMWAQWTSVYSGTQSVVYAPIFNYYLDGEYKDF